MAELLFSGLKAVDSIKKSRSQIAALDWHLLSTFPGCFSSGHFLFLHANTLSEDYPSPLAISGCARVCVSLKMSSGGVPFFPSLICLSLVVIVLPGLLNMCARVCTSSENPELPSNITHGLCFDPPASHSPQPAPEHIGINVPVVGFWVGDTQMHIFLLSVQCFKFTHSLPHFQSQCPPPRTPAFAGECSARGLGRLGSSPHLLGHQKSQRFTPLAAASQP